MRGLARRARGHYLAAMNAEILWLLVPVFGLVVAGVLLARVLRRRPSHDRDWKWGYEQLARVEFGPEGAVTIHNYRDFRWIRTDKGARAGTRLWRDAHFNINHLQAVWYGLSDFSPLGMAHAFISFDFGDEGHVTLSVEARQERKEEYSIVEGLTREYELILILGSEPDIIGLRTHIRGEKLRLYRVNITQKSARALFRRVAARVNRLADTPEFYNSLTTNCTTILVAQDPRISPLRRIFDPRLIRNTNSDILARKLGLIDADLPLAEQRRRATIIPDPSVPPEDPAYSIRIRAGEAA